jgi:SAM-dependent methyltransferase
VVWRVQPDAGVSAMVEPHASQFRRLVRRGAGARDIQLATVESGFARRTIASDAFVDREVARVDTHRRTLCSLLETFASPSAHILDVGCSTGGSTVALALTARLAPELVVGVDPDLLSLRAAEARARGHGLDSHKVVFLRNRPDAALPFPDDRFDLVVCVSVLEFLPTSAGRRLLVEEMKRVARPGGHVFVSTPNPLRFRDIHSKRWFGDFVRREGYPWATSPWELRKMVSDCENVSIGEWVFGRALQRMGLPLWLVPPPLARAAMWTQPWQKVLVRKPEPGVTVTLQRSSRRAPARQ